MKKNTSAARLSNKKQNNKTSSKVYFNTKKTLNNIFLNFRHLLNHFKTVLLKRKKRLLNR